MKTMLRRYSRKLIVEAVKFWKRRLHVLEESSKSFKEVKAIIDKFEKEQLLKKESFKKIVDVEQIADFKHPCNEDSIEYVVNEKNEDFALLKSACNGIMVDKLKTSNSMRVSGFNTISIYEKLNALNVLAYGIGCTRKRYHTNYDNDGSSWTSCQDVSARYYIVQFLPATYASKDLIVELLDLHEKSDLGYYAYTTRRIFKPSISKYAVDAENGLKILLIFNEAYSRLISLTMAKIEYASVPDFLCMIEKIVETIRKNLLAGALKRWTLKNIENSNARSAAKHKSELMFKVTFKHLGVAGLRSLALKTDDSSIDRFLDIMSNAVGHSSFSTAIDAIVEDLEDDCNDATYDEEGYESEFKFNVDDAYEYVCEKLEKALHDYMKKLPDRTTCIEMQALVSNVLDTVSDDIKSLIKDYGENICGEWT